MLFINMAFANSTGNSVAALSWMSRVFAALQACATSALLMVASSGFGITQPKLGRHMLVMVVVMTSAAIFMRLAVLVVQDEELKVVAVAQHWLHVLCDRSTVRSIPGEVHAPHCRPRRLVLLCSRVRRHGDLRKIASDLSSEIPILL